MKLVCLGDSLTRGYKVKAAESWPALVGRKMGIEVVNKGINGDTTGGMLGRFYDSVINERPTHVIITGGGNDLIWGVPLPVIEANLAAMVQQAVHNSIIPIIGIPLPYAAAKAKRYWPFIGNLDEVNKNLAVYRKWILAFAQNFSVESLDFYNLFFNDQDYLCDQDYIDGLHPTAHGHELMSNLVQSILSRQ